VAFQTNPPDDPKAAYHLDPLKQYICFVLMSVV